MTRREIRERAEKLRQSGMSVRDIAKTLGVSRGSVSVWVRDVQLTPTQIKQLQHNQRRFQAQNKGAQANRANSRAKRLEYQQGGRLRAQEGDLLHQAGCLLYWAEGAKHRNRVYFVNSDPNMMRLFMRFLRVAMNVPSTDIALYIHCHTSDKVEQRRIELYWVELLELDETCLRKTQIKKGSDTRRNTLVNGVCGISVARSTALAQHIYGAIQEYGGFDQPAWLF